MNQIYLDTARLLTQVAPLVFMDDTFALQGGTAINLFVRDMPRLSVDLDLVFPDHTSPRDEALARINGAVRLAAERLTKRGFQTHAPASAAGETKVLVRRGSIQVKVEVNFVMRGTPPFGSRTLRSGSCSARNTGRRRRFTTLGSRRSRICSRESTSRSWQCEIRSAGHTRSSGSPAPPR